MKKILIFLSSIIILFVLVLSFDFVQESKAAPINCAITPQFCFEDDPYDGNQPASIIPTGLIAQIIDYVNGDYIGLGNGVYYEIYVVRESGIVNFFNSEIYLINHANGNVYTNEYLVYEGPDGGLNGTEMFHLKANYSEAYFFSTVDPNINVVPSYSYEFYELSKRSYVHFANYSSSPIYEMYQLLNSDWDGKHLFASDFAGDGFGYYFFTDLDMYGDYSNPNVVEYERSTEFEHGNITVLYDNPNDLSFTDNTIPYVIILERYSE